jgi:calcineurin-like phosphoesterase family protein
VKEYYVITDPHLSKSDHKNMLVKCCLRPENYTNIILYNLYKLTKDDVLICLGDVCFGDEIYWHEQLSKINCHSKILVKGNHDKRTYNWYLDNGWDFVCENLTMNYFGYRILFSHKPTHQSYENMNNYNIFINGHFHNNPKDHWEPELVANLTNKRYLLAIEYVNYAPVKLETIIKLIRSGKVKDNIIKINT